MDFEQAIETQRLKLLRIVAGLVLLLGVLSLGPVSRCFSDRVRAFVGSVLSRAEGAARYLVIAQARTVLAQGQIVVSQRQLSDYIDRVFVADENDVSLADGQRRLRVLRAVLNDLPRAALRLLHQIVKHARHTGRVLPNLPDPKIFLPAVLRDWRLVAKCVERPPDRVSPL